MAIDSMTVLVNIDRSIDIFGHLFSQNEQYDVERVISAHGKDWTSYVIPA